MKRPTILLIGTVDTKSDEIAYLIERINAAGGNALLMDVGVLGKGSVTPDISNHQVAQASGHTLQEVIDSGDENISMQWMAHGACLLAARLCAEHRIDGMLALGGTMGTDLALDVANALPLGLPKLVLSTVAYSPLIPPDRIPPDLIMRLWAGGLYGLNSLCKAALSQAAGAVVGACLAHNASPADRPIEGMTSLGSTALSYMKQLKPALEARGYELAVFHTTGMGGRAFEDLAARGYFVAVMDFSLQELVNHLGHSCVSAGADRLRGAGKAGIPQLVAPGATDMVDYPTWQECPARFANRPIHAHNRLIASACIDESMRRDVARTIAARLKEAKGPSTLLLPLRGIEGWDRPGEPLHDPIGLQALCEELQQHLEAPAQIEALDAHINDRAFADKALEIFDGWVKQGLVPQGRHQGTEQSPNSIHRH